MPAANFSRTSFRVCSKWPHFERQVWSYLQSTLKSASKQVVRNISGLDKMLVHLASC